MRRGGAHDVEEILAGRAGVALAAKREDNRVRVDAQAHRLTALRNRHRLLAARVFGEVLHFAADAVLPFAQVNIAVNPAVGTGRVVIRGVYRANLDRAHIKRHDHLVFGGQRRVDRRQRKLPRIVACVGNDDSMRRRVVREQRENGVSLGGSSVRGRDHESVCAGAPGGESPAARGRGLNGLPGLGSRANRQSRRPRGGSTACIIREESEIVLHLRIKRRSQLRRRTRRVPAEFTVVKIDAGQRRIRRLRMRLKRRGEQNQKRAKRGGEKFDGKFHRYISGGVGGNWRENRA